MDTPKSIIIIIIIYKITNNEMNNQVLDFHNNYVNYYRTVTYCVDHSILS